MSTMVGEDEIILSASSSSIDDKPSSSVKENHEVENLIPLSPNKQCELIPEVDNSNQSSSDSKNNEAVEKKIETEASSMASPVGGIIGEEAISGEDEVLETKVEVSVEVGEKLLSESRILHGEGGSSPSKLDVSVETNEVAPEIGGVVEDRKSDAGNEGNSVSCAGDHRHTGLELEVSTEEIEVSTEGITSCEREVAPTVDGNENDSDMDAPKPVFTETSDAADLVGSRALGCGLADGESCGSEAKTLHLTGEEPATDPETAEEVALPKESSAVVMETERTFSATGDVGESSAVVMETERTFSATGDVEKSASELDNDSGAQPSEGKDLMEETLESKVDMETAAEVVNVTEVEHNNTNLEVSGLVGTEAPVEVGMQEKEKDRSSDPKIENEISTNLESSNVQFDASETSSKSEENRELTVAAGTPTEETETEIDEMVTEVENNEDSDGESVPNLEDPLVRPQDEEDEELIAEEGTPMADTGMETETDALDSGTPVGGKRKRGKNSKISGTKTTSRSGKMMDEDVCFICFDGGDLVICDRRGCPKAYHPSCVNRDEAFFRSKGRWNCGWHICSKCEKNAHYMCYTCTFSLCKGCIKDDVILCVRGNKGFCETCMRTVKQIENSNLSYKDGQVDFDDRSSWEFLFKDYYTDLKSKLSLTSVEISEAKNPRKGSVMSAVKEDSPDALVVVSNAGGSGSENSTEKPEASKPKRRKANKRRNLVKEKGLDGAAASVDGEGISVSTPGSTEWASKELLDFVMHMKNGDKSVSSQFDVQALLLEYIKRNKLRDPRKKSQIICDSRLQNLFGKPRVGHFEMLKLLESHFPVKEDSHTDDAQGTVVDTEANHLEANENVDTPPKEIKDKKRKVRKKGDGRGSQSDRYEYAAIDMHNIGLIYLRRKLMEDLLEDVDEFQNKVIGTFVRIRISGNMQKQDLYRLVQVVGTSKADEPYKVGKRTTDMMLEILNLNKKELVSIDSISNQDFTEEECKRLRQSIKFGLLSRMTVGDILDKALEIQVARVNDWLESETLRLGHLRDRASDMGRRKELRECVEKLEILKTPEERLRRLEEVPQVHTDPKMDPSHESDEHDSESDDNKREVFAKSRSSGYSRRGRAPISPRIDFSSKDSWNVGKTSGKNWEVEGNFSSKNSLNSVDDAIQSDELAKENAWNQGIEREAPELDTLVKFNTFSKTDKVGWTNQCVSRSESATAMMNSSASTAAREVLSASGSANSSSAKETETAVKVNETQKMWHYQDPSGKVQGPFSMVQLRKWSNTGYFPADLKIWRTSEKQDESILLTDVLAGRFQKRLPTGDGVNPLSGGLQSAHVLSGLSGKISEISLQLQQAREAQNIGQNSGAKTSRQSVSKGFMTPSVEAAKLSAEKWTRADSMGLPSPTPKRSNAGGNGEGNPLINATLLPDNIPSATSEQGNLSSMPAPTEQLTRSLEISRTANIENIVNGSRMSLQSSSTKPGEPHAAERHSHLPQENLGIPTQPIPSQNPHVATHGWVGKSTQKVETNSGVPVPGQAQAYSTWAAVTTTHQNPVGSFPDLTTSSMPQPEFWRPPVQGNQPNMQPVGTPNLSWGAGMMENNPSTTSMRPENPNAGWVPMQGTPNPGWGGPVPGATNMNWVPTVQGPAPGSGNSGWGMPPVNMGTTIQGPMPGNVNPGWVAPTGNPASQGIGPGIANSSWVAAPAGNMGSAIVPGPGNGWMLPPGNPVPPPVQAPPLPPPQPSGNPNHGWGAPVVGNQGFPGPRDNKVVSHVGDSGYGGGRPWNNNGHQGQPSPLGNGGGSVGGPLRHMPKRQTMCPYNINGRCKKGASCDYRHA